MLIVCETFLAKLYHLFKSADQMNNHRLSIPLLVAMTKTYSPLNRKELKVN